MKKSLKTDTKFELLSLIDSFNEIIIIKTDKLNKEWREEMDKQKLINEMNKKIDELKNEFLEKIAALEEKKPYEISYPKDNKIVFYIDDYIGELKERPFDITDSCDKRLYNMGLYFDTKEEAEQFKREQTLIKKIKCWAKEQQGDWQPDWKDDEIKYYIMEEYDRLETDYTVCYRMFTKLPYFKSEEIAQACIDEFGDEILEVFC